MAMASVVLLGKFTSAVQIFRTAKLYRTSLVVLFYAQVRRDFLCYGDM